MEQQHLATHISFILMLFVQMNDTIVNLKVEIDDLKTELIAI